ncbi:unnamed protein product, partial [Mesorhabditis spiculigera]
MELSCDIDDNRWVVVRPSTSSDDPLCLELLLRCKHNDAIFATREIKWTPKEPMPQKLTYDAELSMISLTGSTMKVDTPYSIKAAKVICPDLADAPQRVITLKSFRSAEPAADSSDRLGIFLAILDLVNSQGRDKEWKALKKRVKSVEQMPDLRGHFSHYEQKRLIDCLDAKEDSPSFLTIAKALAAANVFGYFNKFVELLTDAGQDELLVEMMDGMAVMSETLYAGILAIIAKKDKPEALPLLERLLSRAYGERFLIEQLQSLDATTGARLADMLLELIGAGSEVVYGQALRLLSVLLDALGSRFIWGDAAHEQLLPMAGTIGDLAALIDTFITLDSCRHREEQINAAIPAKSYIIRKVKLVPIGGKKKNKKKKRTTSIAGDEPPKQHIPAKQDDGKKPKRKRSAKRPQKDAPATPVPQATPLAQRSRTTSASKSTEHTPLASPTAPPRSRRASLRHSIGADDIFGKENATASETGRRSRNRHSTSSNGAPEAQESAKLPDDVAKPRKSRRSSGASLPDEPMDTSEPPETPKTHRRSRNGLSASSNGTVDDVVEVEKTPKSARRAPEDAVDVGKTPKSARRAPEVVDDVVKSPKSARRAPEDVVDVGKTPKSARRAPEAVDDIVKSPKSARHAPEAADDTVKSVRRTQLNGSSESLANGKPEHHEVVVDSKTPRRRSLRSSDKDVEPVDEPPKSTRRRQKQEEQHDVAKENGDLEGATPAVSKTSRRSQKLPNGAAGDGGDDVVMVESTPSLRSASRRGRREMSAALADDMDGPYWKPAAENEPASVVPSQLPAGTPARFTRASSVMSDCGSSYNLRRRQSSREPEPQPVNQNKATPAKANGIPETPKQLAPIFEESAKRKSAARKSKVNGSSAPADVIELSD